MFPGRMFAIASLDSANMNTSTFSTASLTVESEANVSPIWRLRNKVEVSMLAFAEALIGFSSLLPLKLAFAFSLPTLVVVIPIAAFVVEAREFLLWLRRSQSQRRCEESLFEVRIFRDPDKRFSQCGFGSVHQFHGLTPQPMLILEHQRPVGFDAILLVVQGHLDSVHTISKDIVDKFLKMLDLQSSQPVFRLEFR